MRPATGVLLLAIVLSLGGCGAKHVRECGGGLEVQLAVPTSAITTGRTLYVRLTVNGAPQDHLFELSGLDEEGRGSFVIHFDITTPTTVMGYAEIRETNGAPVVMVSNEVTIEPATSGCFLLSLFFPGASVPDASVADANPNTPDADPNAPDGGVADAWVGDDGGILFDEDGDGVPDGLDNCPHVFNPAQEESTTDLDSLGDACDPHKNDNQWYDEILHFDGFNVNDTSLYDINVGGWLISGGAVEQLVTTPGLRALGMDTSFGGCPYGETRVFTRATVLEDNSAQEHNGAGVFTGADPLSFPDGYSCFGTVGTSAVNVLRKEPAGIANTLAITASLNTPFDAWVRDDQMFGNVECEVAGVKQAVSDYTGSSGAGLFTANVRARFDYLVVIQSYEMTMP